MIWFLIGVVVGAVAMWGWQHKPRKKTPVDVASAPKPKTYGHPHPPVPYLKKQLPEPPGGFFWEVRVAPAERDGTPFLHLALINASTGKSVAETKRDLINGAYATYARDYRRYSSIKDSTFRNDLMGPLLDWAEAKVHKHTDPNLVGEYTVES